MCTPRINERYNFMAVHDMFCLCPFFVFLLCCLISCLCLSLCHILLTFLLFLLGEGSSAREDGAGEEHRAAADPQPGDRPHQGARG